MEKIQRVSLFFRIVFQIIFIALPITLVMSWIYAPEQLLLLSGALKFDAIPENYKTSLLHTLTLNEKLLGGLASAVPMIVYMYILLMLIKLFRLYGKGEIFSMAHVKYISKIGYALLITQLIEPFYQFGMGFILTMNNPHGHRFASITLDQTNGGVLLTALLVILISWIMREGYKLREEQELTV